MNRYESRAPARPSRPLCVPHFERISAVLPRCHGSMLLFNQNLFSIRFWVTAFSFVMRCVSITRPIHLVYWLGFGRWFWSILCVLAWSVHNNNKSNSDKQKKAQNQVEQSENSATLISSRQMTVDAIELKYFCPSIHRSQPFDGVS